MRYVCSECGEWFERPGTCARDGRPLDATEDPVVGSEVGRYRIARLLAEGGMGRVYLGVQPAIGSRVAIKLLADSTSPDLLDRFFAEARAVNLIRHENIVSVLDMAKLDDGRPYIVMEYIEGQTLASLVKAGAAPLGGVVQVMLEVLGALAAAHAIGIVHRDLKPDNVLVTGEGHAKVLDFGIAKLMPGISQQLSPRTRTGALLGTPAYMAPEQISGSGSVDPRTDIYAAGIVFYEAVTGRVPFAGETLFDLMRMHLEVPPPSPRALRPELPQALEDVILTALAKDPAHRFQAAGAMAQAVQHASAELRPEDWRSLSTRGAIITGGRVSTAHLARRPPPPSHPPSPGSATTPLRAPRRADQPSTTVASPTPRQDAQATRPMPASAPRRLPWLLAIAATAVIAVLATLLVVRARGTPATPSSASGAETTTATTDTASDPATQAGSNTASDPGANAVSNPASSSANPASDTASNSASNPASTSASDPASTSASNPAANPASNPASDPVSKSASNTASNPASNPVSNPASSPASSPAANPASKPASSTASKTASSTASNTGADPTANPASSTHSSSGGVGGAGTAAPTPTQIVVAADYDPKRFDPMAYLPKAIALARRLYPDAKLTRFDFVPVRSSGLVDLTMPDAEGSYELRSALHSRHPAGVPRNVPVERPCMVYVELEAKRVTARIVTNDDCDDRLVRVPRCKLADVWKQARDAGVPDDYVAKISWLFDEKWFFDSDLANRGDGTTTSFPDRCP